MKCNAFVTLSLSFCITSKLFLENVLYHWLSSKKTIGNCWVLIAVQDYTVRFQIVNKSLSSPRFLLAKENKPTKGSLYFYFLLEADLDWAVDKEANEWKR